MTANLNVTAATTATPATVTGTYAVSGSCLYTAKLTDSTGKTWTLALSVITATGADFDIIGTNPQLMFSGTAHSSFGNPQSAVVNGASFRADFSPPGTVFSIFGQGLASNTAQASMVPLPTNLLSSTVTVNGVPAPLFYVSPGQINAQLPVNIPLGLATVVVKNGSSTSNAVAINVPEVGPGIVTFSQNGETRAVVVNPDNSVNTRTSPARVGQILVAYFTGGGPVQDKGLLTGQPAPSGLSPITNDYSLTVGGRAAMLTYVGLTPGSIGLYQANFQVPQVAAGDHPVILSIAGLNSNAADITVAN
jgi:uncharacterized protein (TIGR03437 family)